VSVGLQMHLRKENEDESATDNGQHCKCELINTQNGCITNEVIC
jgi:hypothetical protein